jgi:hypothetical protein
LSFLKPVAHLAFGHHGNTFKDIIGKNGYNTFTGIGAAEATVMGAYGITASYVLANTAYSFAKTLKHSDRKSRLGKLAQATVDAGETLIFQTAASLTIPAAMINLIRNSDIVNNSVVKGLNLLNKGLANRTVLGVAAKTWGVGFVALAAMPLIAKTVDWAVDKVLDYTYKPLSHGLVNKLFAPKDEIAAQQHHAKHQKELLI